MNILDIEVFVNRKPKQSKCRRLCRIDFFFRLLVNSEMNKDIYFYKGN